MNEPIRELNGRVEAYQQAWSTHQAPAVAAFFTRDTDVIIGNGPRVVGREAIQIWWEGYFEKIAATRQDEAISLQKTTRASRQTARK